MFPKTGNTFPKKDASRVSQLDYAKAVAKALRRELGNSHQAAKTVMKWTGANERTVKNWLAGTRGPSGGHLVSLIRESRLVLEALLQISERPASLAAVKLFKLRDRLAEELRVIQEILRELPIESTN
jgi:hypothetical protein